MSLGPLKGLLMSILTIFCGVPFGTLLGPLDTFFREVRLGYVVSITRLAGRALAAWQARVQGLRLGRLGSPSSVVFRACFVT